MRVCRNFASLVLRKVRAVTALALNVSIKGKIMGMVLVLIISFGLWTTLQIRHIVGDSMSKELGNKAISIARDLAARSEELVLINNTYALHSLLMDTLENNPDLLYAFIINQNGRVIAHTFQEGFPLQLLEVNQVLEPDTARLQLLSTEEGIIRDVAAPIAHGYGGVVRIGITEKSVYRVMDQVSESVITIVFFLGALGVGLSYLLTFLMTRPIANLVSATEDVTRGNLERKARVYWDDEIGRLAKRFNEMTGNLSRARGIRDKLLKKVISAQEDERRRISRELHDEIGQALTAMAVQLKVLEKEFACSTTAVTRIEAIRSLTEETIEELRRLSAQLRPASLDDLGLITALKDFVRKFGAHFNLEVDLYTRGFENLELADAVKIAVYRIIQEALTNVARHAQANNVSVIVEYRDGYITAIVEDDGVGFRADSEEDLPTERLGILGMKERCHLFGGSLTIESSSQGTCVYARIPVDGGDSSGGTGGNG